MTVPTVEVEFLGATAAGIGSDNVLLDTIDGLDVAKTRFNELGGTGDGVYFGLDRWQSREVFVGLLNLSDDQLEEWANAAVQAKESADLVALRFRGMPRFGDRTEWRRAMVRYREFPYTLGRDEHLNNVYSARLRVEAPSPLILDDDAHEEEVAATEGLTITNPGNVVTADTWELVARGPFTGLSVSSDYADTAVIDLPDLVVASDTELVITGSTRGIVARLDSGGELDCYAYAQGAVSGSKPEFFPIPPGDSVITCSRDATFTWRPAWI